jgi:hypothetical protein
VISKELRQQIKEGSRDQGSGVFWQLLHRDFLDLIFKVGYIRDFLLARSQPSYAIHWNRDYGVGTISSSNRLALLVTTPSGAKSLRYFLEKHGGFSNIENKLQSSDGRTRTAMLKAVVEAYSEVVVIGKSKDYTDAGAFIADHTKRKGERIPRKVLFSENTVDTGKMTDFVIKSISTPGERFNVIASNPKYATPRQISIEDEATGTLFRRSAPKLKNMLGPAEDEIEVYHNNPYMNPDDASIADEMVWATAKRGMEVLAISDVPVPPVMSVGGEKDTFSTEVGSHHLSNRNIHYKTEGSSENQLALRPSTFFYPMQPVISSFMSALGALDDNPALILGLVALAISSEKKETYYTNIHNTLPSRIIDLADQEE